MSSKEKRRRREAGTSKKIRLKQPRRGPLAFDGRGDGHMRFSGTVRTKVVNRVDPSNPKAIKTILGRSDFFMRPQG